MPRPEWLAHLLSVISFTIAGGKVVEILADPDWLGRLDLAAVER